MALENNDIGRSFQSLAATLAQASPTGEGSLDLAYKDDKSRCQKSDRPAADFTFARRPVN